MGTQIRRMEGGFWSRRGWPCKHNFERRLDLPDGFRRPVGVGARGPCRGRGSNYGWVFLGLRCACPRLISINPSGCACRPLCLHHFVLLTLSSSPCPPHFVLLTLSLAEADGETKWKDKVMKTKWGEAASRCQSSVNGRVRAGELAGRC